ncbi:hypothetical protein LCGC14_2480810, partial [marine sediment metagenome]
ATDGVNVFAVGWLRTTSGNNVRLLVDKFDVNGLANADIEYSGGYENASFNKVRLDTNFIYAAGVYRPDGSSASSGVICKINKSDLSLDTGKKLDPVSTKATVFFGLELSGGHLYITGRTNDEGEGEVDAIVAVLNLSDLSEEQTKMFGKTSSSNDEKFYGCAVDGKHIFTVNTISTEPLIAKFGGRETIQEPFIGPEREPAREPAVREPAMSIENANIGESRTRQLTVKEIKQAMPWLSERELKKLRRLQQQQGWSRR